MKPEVFFIVLTSAYIIYGAPADKIPGKRVARYTSKVQDLKQKLILLQEMLEDVNDGREQKTKAEGLKVAPATTAEANRDRPRQEPMRSQNENEAEEQTTRQAKIKTLARRLADGDRKALQVLENALKKLQTENEDARRSDKGTTGEELGLKEAEDRDKGIAAEGMRSSEMEHNIMAILRNLQHHTQPRLTAENVKPRTETRPQIEAGHYGGFQPRTETRPQIEEGHFGGFQEEVLHALEGRLEKDLELALDSGFSVKDIIDDLQEANGRWSETRRSEIERELDTLQTSRRSM